jgi:hypothetical protein
MKRLDQVLALAARLNDARAEVTRLEAELEALFEGRAPAKARIDSRGTQPARPGRRSRKEAGVAAAAAAPGEPPIPPAVRGETGPGHYPRPTDERRDRIVALAKDGRSPTDIAAQLGVGPRIVNMTLWRARKAGRLPKGGKSR